MKLGKRKLETFLSWRPSTAAKLAESEQNVAELLKELLDTTKYLDSFDRKNEDDLSRLENIQEFLNVATQFKNVSDFLENIALLQNDYFVNGKTQIPEENMVNLMSLHAAKGLEFGVVFMAGMEEGLFPHARALLDPEQMEEERRLCYVGITRAKSQLYLSYARSRFMYGSTTHSTRSRFLADIDPALVSFHASEPQYESSYGSSYGSGYNPNKQRQKSASNPWAGNTRSTAGRRLVVEDDMLDDILSGDLDIEALIER